MCFAIGSAFAFINESNLSMWLTVYMMDRFAKKKNAFFFCMMKKKRELKTKQIKMAPPQRFGMNTAVSTSLMSTVALGAAFGFVIGGKVYNAWKLQFAVLLYCVSICLILLILYFINSPVFVWVLFPLYGIAYGLYFIFFSFLCNILILLCVMLFFSLVFNFFVFLFVNDLLLQIMCFCFVCLCACL